MIKKMRTAIKEGNLETVKQLLDEEKGLLQVETTFGSWLHVAADQGKLDIVKYLIDCGMDVNKNGGISGGSPMHSAARKGRLDIVELLYENGAIFDVTEAAKNPLFGAICNGHYDVVKFLVEKGIDIKVCYSIGQIEAVDAYEYARQFGQTQIADHLKKRM